MQIISIQRIYIIDFNHSISLMFSATNVNHFKLSNIHSNNDELKTIKRLKKFAKFVETLMRNKFFIFYVQVIQKSFENDNFDCFVSERTSEIKISKTFSRIDRTLFTAKTYQNIFVKKFHDDFNNSMWFQLEYAKKKLYECDTNSNQKDDKNFAFDTINKKSIKMHCIVDVSIAWTVNATNKTIFEIMQEFHIVSQERCWFYRNWSWKKQQLNHLIIFDRIRIASCKFNNYTNSIIMQ